MIFVGGLGAMRRSSAKILFIVLVSLNSFGCAAPNVESVSQTKPGRSLVIGSAYYRYTVVFPRGSFYPWSPPSEKEFVRDVRLVFWRADPPSEKKVEASWHSDIDEYGASNALPGRYKLAYYKLGTDYHGGGIDHSRHEIEVKEGEAVYIGDLMFRSYSSFEVIDNEEQARGFFEKNFKGSGLKFVKRLIRRTGPDPTVPK